jgi:hypothetical protein
LEFAFVCFDPIVNAANESSAACCLSFRLSVETGAPPRMCLLTATGTLPQAGIFFHQPAQPGAFMRMEK